MLTIHLPTGTATRWN